MSLRRKAGTYPDVLAKMSDDDFRDLGKTYVERLSRDGTAKDRIVDKLPANFLFVGLIHLALPRARIIHVKRNAVDTCVSCYSLLFAEDQPFAYDLGEIGRYYRAYESLMDHWRAVLPPGRMLEVEYEEIVKDLEGQARRLVAHCGVDWDKRCLAFHETKRPGQHGKSGPGAKIDLRQLRRAIALLRLQAQAAHGRARDRQLCFRGCAGRNRRASKTTARPTRDGGKPVGSGRSQG